MGAKGPGAKPPGAKSPGAKPPNVDVSTVALSPFQLSTTNATSVGVPCRHMYAVYVPDILFEKVRPEIFDFGVFASLHS
jgi:hypothetical protein